MADLTLVYGMRLLPADEVEKSEKATLQLKNGAKAHVTMHVLEGSKDEIEKQLRTSVEAFFDFYRKLAAPAAKPAPYNETTMAVVLPNPGATGSCGGDASQNRWVLWGASCV